MAFKMVSLGNNTNSQFKLCMPTFGDHLHLEDSYHIVMSKNKNFVTNNIDLSKDRKCILLSGPNMGGKSTLMRQLATTVVLAQCGCFIPASSGTLPVFNKLFSRIGAQDDLIRSKSTF